MLGFALLLSLAPAPPGVSAAPRLAPAQEPIPEGVVAAWDGGSVGEARFERFLGRSFRGKTLGREALVHLLQIQVVQREAEARGLEVSAQEIDARIADARRQAETAGLELDAVLAERGIDMAHFRSLIRDSILHEALTRADLGLDAGAEVTPEQQQEWTEARIEKLLEQAQDAPAGYALDAPPFVVTEAELGRTIRMALPALRLQDYVEQLTLQEYLEAWAAENGVVLTDDVLEEEIAWRRRRVEENPAFGGMSYEALLQTQGSTVESVRQGGELRAAGYLRLLARERFPDSWFEALAPEERAALEAQHGEARHVSWLLLRCVEEAADPLDLSYEAGAEELEHYRSRIESEADFRSHAELYSEHEASARRGGAIGWVHRAEEGVDPEISRAAFETPLGELSQPVRTSLGMALVLATGSRPAPVEDEFRELVRRSKHAELRAFLIAEIGLRTVYAQP